MVKPIEILIVDDHPIIMDGIIARLKLFLDKPICYQAHSIRTALSILKYHNINLIISDLEFTDNPKWDGFTFIKKIKSFEPRIKAITFTNYYSYRIMKKALDNGFDSFLNKGCSDDDFKTTIEAVLSGQSHESEAMKGLSKKRHTFIKSIFSESLYGLSDLTTRELEFVIKAKESIERNDLAKTLNIKPYTVDTYFKNIRNKLGLKNRQELNLFINEFEKQVIKELKNR